MHRYRFAAGRVLRRAKGEGWKGRGEKERVRVLWL